MPAIVRRTATKIVNGRVSRKNRSAISEIAGYQIVKEHAGKGFRHVVSARQLRDFLELIPDWKSLSFHLETIALARGREDWFGYQTSYTHRKTGVIALCAWPKALWWPLWNGFFRQHRHIFEALGVPYQTGLSQVTCKFTVAQARAFSLLHVFLHEVGHHRDWLRRRGVGLPGKEEFAEEFANNRFETMLPHYKERFGDPAHSRTEYSGEEA